MKNISKAALNEIVQKLSVTDNINYTAFAKDIIDQYDAKISESNLRKGLKLVHQVLAHSQNKDTAPHLKLVKETTDKDGNLVGQVHALRKENLTDLEGMEVVGITQTPFGGSFVKYAKKEVEVLEDKDYLKELAVLLSKEIEPVCFDGKVESSSILKVLLSDRHIAAKVDKESLYPNQYDKEEYKKRIDNVTNRILELNESNGGFDVIQLVDCGDLFDGWNALTTRGLMGKSNHHLPQNMNNREAFECFLEIEKNFISTIAEKCKFNALQLHYTCNDNHSGDQSFMALRAFEIYLKVKYPSIKVTIQTKFLEHFTLGNETCIITHGRDREHRKSGFPKNLDHKTTIYVNDYIRHHGIEGKTTLYRGDLHDFGICQASTFKDVLLPSVFGSSDWAMSNFPRSKAGYCLELNGFIQSFWFDCRKLQDNI